MVKPNVAISLPMKVFSTQASKVAQFSDKTPTLTAHPFRPPSKVT